MNISLNNNKINFDKIFPQLLGSEAKSTENFFCAHIGPSMNPTLTAQDLLEIKPFHNERPQVGDVILFQPPGHDQYVVHRIISITANGIQTRGDNNCNIDTEFLKKEDIYGQVIAAQRGNSRRKVANGFMGSIIGRSRHLQRKFSTLLVKLLGPIYRALSTGGLLHWLLPFRMQPQVASFKTGKNISHKLLLGKIVIGSYDDNRLQWQIRRPYRLFVDEASLPTPR